MEEFVISPPLSHFFFFFLHSFSFSSLVFPNHKHGPWDFYHDQLFEQEYYKEDVKRENKDRFLQGSPPAYRLENKKENRSRAATERKAQEMEVIISLEETASLISLTDAIASVQRKPVRVQNRKKLA
jgi:hypothetical protein